MDPVSITGLILSAQQLISYIFAYGAGVKDSGEEIGQLCSELFALKAALEHVQMNADANIALDEPQGVAPAFSSPLFETKEFSSMVSTTDTLLKVLIGRFPTDPGRLKSAWRKLTWPLKKDDIQQSIQRLERLKMFFVMATTTDNMELCRHMYREICSLTELLNNQQDVHDKKAQREFRTSVIEWLTPYDPSLFYQKALAAHQVGTGGWFLDGPFHEWSTYQSPAILWLRGKPGVGKTTLLSAAVNELKLRDPKSRINPAAYFYCSFTDSSSQDPVNVLGSFIVQLCSANVELWTDIDARYRSEINKSENNPKKLSLDELESALKDICESLHHATLFLDAPNESKESSIIISTLWRLAQSNDLVRIMISSTEEMKMPKSQPDKELVFPVAIDAKAIDNDVADYIDSWLGTHERLHDLPKPLKDKIQSKLLQGADGMFRWVQCQLESLVLQNTAFDIKTALEGVPSSLEQTYSNILARIPMEDRSVAKEALFWLTFSLRSLSFPGLCEAVIIKDDSASINKDARLLRPEKLLKTCSSLISYDANTNRVTLAHSSVRAYLTSQQTRDSEAGYFYLDINTANNVLTCKVLNYLSISDLRTGYCETQQEIDKRWRSWPFLRYCVDTWPRHVQILTEETLITGRTLDLLLHFFGTAKKTRGGNFGAWVQLFLPFGTQLNIANSTPLYYASRFGLTSVVKIVLAMEGTADMEIRGGRRGSTPLHCASAFGQIEVVKTLLAAGADAKEVNQKGENGLQWAARRGDTDIARVLLAAGAESNSQDGRGYTALSYAIASGDEDCIFALLEGGAEVTEPDADILRSNMKHFSVEGRSKLNKTYLRHVVKSRARPRSKVTRDRTMRQIQEVGLHSGKRLTSR